jgi:endoglucanase
MLSRVRRYWFLSTIIVLMTSWPLQTTARPDGLPSNRIAAFQAGSAVTHATADLRRGISFGDAMDAPNEGDWGWKISASDFVAVRQAGFDHVRVPMRISAHAGRRPPYLIEPKFLRRMDWAVDQALSNHLGIVIDMHHYEEIMRDPVAEADRIVQLWQQIARRYQGLPSAVAYELLNEPTANLTAPVWNQIVARIITAIRAIDPTRVLIVDAVRWASAIDLRDTLLLPAGDRNLIGSFHLYEPTFFTHQGAGWMPPEYGTHGVVFPGPPQTFLEPIAPAAGSPKARAFFEGYNARPVETNPGGPSVVIEQLDIARSFADRTGLRVYLGEFGTIINADLPSRVRWTSLVREEAEKRGFAWAYWDYCRNLAVYRPCGPKGRWIPELKDALLEATR